MKIAILDPVGTYFHAPALRCMLEELDRLGCKMDIYLRTGGERLSTICSALPKPFPIPFRVWAGDVENTLRQWKYFAKYNAAAGHISSRRNHYDLLIGLNPEGVIAAHRLWCKRRTPFVYLSFEMIFMDELQKGGNRQLKREEVAASQDAALIISQDPWRAELLQRENNIPLSKITFLPVAPRAGSSPKRTNYLRERFRIAKCSTIVINAGAFNAFTRADDIIDSLRNWPSGFDLVVNTHYQAKAIDIHIGRLRSLGLPNVHITDGSMPAEEYEQMLASADIGLALYKNLYDGKMFHGKNTETMGFSSGKLASYSRAGVPSIIMGNPQLKTFMFDQPFGVYIEHPCEIPNALLQIQKQRQHYGDAARRFFLDHLDFGRFWPPLWQKIKSLC